MPLLPRFHRLVSSHHRTGGSLRCHLGHPGLQHPPEAWIACLLGWMLLALGWINVEWFLLPDFLTLPLLLSGLGVTILAVPDDMFWHALGAVCGYLGLRRHRVALSRSAGTRGSGCRRCKAAGRGRQLAWPRCAAIDPVAGRDAGLAFAGIAAAAGRMMRATAALPFGAFLAASIWLVWLLLPDFAAAVKLQRPDGCPQLTSRYQSARTGA